MQKTRLKHPVDKGHKYSDGGTVIGGISVEIIDHTGNYKFTDQSAQEMVQRVQDILWDAMKKWKDQPDGVELRFD